MGLQWDQIVVLLSVVAGWSLVIIATVRFILSRCFKQCDTRACVQEEATRNLERGILEMKAELPLAYVRREDFIRYEVVVNTKLDRLSDQIGYIKEKMQ